MQGRTYVYIFIYIEFSWDPGKEPRETDCIERSTIFHGLSDTTTSGEMAIFVSITEYLSNMSRMQLDDCNQ
jgi:hypothetical protein